MFVAFLQVSVPRSPPTGALGESLVGTTQSRGRWSSCNRGIYLADAVRVQVRTLPSQTLYSTHLCSLQSLDPAAMVFSWIEAAMFADACLTALTCIDMMVERRVQVS